MSQPQTVICTYRVKPGKENEMLALLAKHWPTLHRAGLVTDEPAKVYRGLPAAPGKRHAAGPNTFVEIFAWKDEKASDVAHHSPQIMQVWEPMGAICESMEFPHFEPIAL